MHEKVVPFLEEVCRIPFRSGANKFMKGNDQSKVHKNIEVSEMDTEIIVASMIASRLSHFYKIEYDKANITRYAAELSLIDGGFITDVGHYMMYGEWDDVAMYRDSIERKINKLFDRNAVEILTETKMDGQKNDELDLMLSVIWEVIENIPLHAYSYTNRKERRSSKIDAKKIAAITVVGDNKNGNICFSISDMGTTIPRTINNYLSRKRERTLEPNKAIEWALVYGNSTKDIVNSIESKEPGGRGLAELSRLAKTDSIEVLIVSGNGWVNVSKDISGVSNLGVKGTQIFIKISGLNNDTVFDAINEDYSEEYNEEMNEIEQYIKLALGE